MSITERTVSEEPEYLGEQPFELLEFEGGIPSAHGEYTRIESILEVGDESYELGISELDDSYRAQLRTEEGGLVDSAHVWFDESAYEMPGTEFELESMIYEELGDSLILSDNSPGSRR